MTEHATTDCARCRVWESENRQLKLDMQSLQERLSKVELQLAKSRKTSTNSSKPPSSDIVKPPRADGKKGKRKRGAQPGHPRHDRPPFAQADIHETIDYSCAICPDCGGPVQPLEAPPRILQQVELPAQPNHIVEHRALAGWCPHCAKQHHGLIPPQTRRAGLVGPRLTAMVAYLKGACHCSFSTIRKWLRDVMGIAISRGQLRKVCAKVADSLDPPYQELLDLLPSRKSLNVDETGHKDNGKRFWTWCFRAHLHTLFRIAPTRSADVLVEVLGKEFKGVLGCDYFGAYHKYMGDFNVLVQFCLAHLIRDIKFLTEHPHARTRSYGRRVLDAVRELFRVIHRREQMSAQRYATALENAGAELQAQALWRVPGTAEAQNLANRFEQHGDSYLRFITTPGIEPTNNLAEQAIRFVVLDRHVTQGSRSLAGQRWLERIWTAVATCTQQGRSVFEFLDDAIQALFHGTAPPSLLPDTS